jgi:sulfate/thiosulfate transport system permease protein
MITSAATKSSLAVRGAALAYLGLLVALPLGVLVYQTARSGQTAFFSALVDPIALHALFITFVTAAVMVVINVFTGTATAWVLVRYPFPGKNLVNALIDLPFAVPTVVAGVMLVALYGPASVAGTLLGHYGMAVIYQQPGIVLALLFVTFPFVVRSVQPVLLALDSAEEEAAWTLGAGAWTTFRRVTLPAIMPAILTGAGLSFSRALGEFGSVVMVAGNRPMSTKTAPLYIFGEIESGHRYEAMAISVVLLAGSLGLLVLLNRLQRQGSNQHGH